MYNVAVISQNYKITYKNIVSDHSETSRNPIQMQTSKVLSVLGNNSLKIQSVSMGVTELMSYLKWGEEWSTKEVKSLYNYQNSSPLNGIYLEQLLQKEGFSPLLLENFQNEKQRLEEELKKGLAYVVISTTFITDINPILEMCSFVKEINPSVITIVGGPLIHQVFDTDNAVWQMQVNTILNQLKGLVDYYIIEKKGEKTLVQFLKVLENGEDVAGVSNLLYYKETQFVRTAAVAEAGLVDDITIDYGAIASIAEKRYLSLITSRGCVFKCNFCTYHEVFPKIEYKSMEVIKQELDSLKPLKQGKRLIRLADDNFAISSKRLQQFCRLLIDNSYNFNWSCFASHHSMMEYENVHLMAESGCKLVFIGIESADQGILDNMHKKVQVKDFYQVIANLKKAGILSIGSFVVGFPGETEETIEKTIRFINESGLDFYQLNLCHIFPTMTVYKDRYKWGLKGLMYGWSHNTMNSLQAAEAIVYMTGKIERCLTGGFSDTSVQGCLEYLYSIGLEEKDFIPIYEYYTAMLKKNIQNNGAVPVTALEEFDLLKQHYQTIEKKIII